MKKQIFLGNDRLAEKYKDTCLIIPDNYQKTIEEAINDYNKKYYTDIDYRYCALFRYSDKFAFNMSNLIACGYNNFIFL